MFFLPQYLCVGGQKLLQRQFQRLVASKYSAKGKEEGVTFHTQTWFSNVEYCADILVVKDEPKLKKSHRKRTFARKRKGDSKSAKKPRVKQLALEEETERWVGDKALFLPRQGVFSYMSVHTIFNERLCIIDRVAPGKLY